MGLPEPARVCIAAILKLYLVYRFPNEEDERAAPHQGPVWDALSRHAEDIRGLRGAQITSLTLFLLDEMEAVSQVRGERALAPLLRRLGTACGPAPLPDTLADVLGALQSPDDLITLLGLLQELLRPSGHVIVSDGSMIRPSHLERESVFGVFLRKLLLDCNGLGFEGLASLLDDIKAYVAHAETDADEMMPVPTGSREAQQYLQRRVLDLDQNVGRRTYEDTEAEVERLLRRHPELPRGQFLCYLNSTRHGEFTGALDSLHRYFDYAIRRGGPNATGKTSTSRNIVQYAALNLAALHFRLGHTALAFAAINETVRVAQQNSDHLCVAFALAWLYQLLARAGDPQAEEVLFRCLGRAADQKLRHLESTAALSLATFEIQGASRFHGGAFHMPGGGGAGAGVGGSTSSSSSLSHPAQPPAASLGGGGCGGSRGGGGTGTGGTAGIVVGGESSRPRSVWNLLRLSVAAETAGLAPSLGVAAPTNTTGPPQPASATLSASLASALQSRDAFPLTLAEGLELASRRCLVAAGAWELLGHRELMLTQAKKLLYCYNKGEQEPSASHLDTYLARLKVALASLRGGGGSLRQATDDGGAAGGAGGGGGGGGGGISHYNSTPQFQPSPKQALLQSGAGKRRRRTSGDGGAGGGGGGGGNDPSLYGAALDELAALQDDFPVPVDNLLPHTVTMLEHEQALLRGQSRRAYELGLRLRGLSASTTAEAGGKGLEAHVEGQLQWALGLLETGRASQCVQATQQLADLCERQRLPWHYMRCLLQLARAYLVACPSDPTGALPPLLRCLTLCETFDTDPLHATTTALLAQVHLRLGAPSKARALLKAALPVLLEHAPVRDQGDAWLTLAQCYLQELSSTSAAAVGGAAGDGNDEEGEDDEDHVRPTLLRALALLGRALPAFRQAQDLRKMREVYYLEARLHDRLAQLQQEQVVVEDDAIDHVALREEAAKHFFEVSDTLRVNSAAEAEPLAEGDDDDGEATAGSNSN